MNRKEAKELAKQYVTSWLARDTTRFLDTLHDEVVVRECYGPVYESIDDCEDWFRTWHADGGRVTDWTITSFLFDSETNTAAFEWDFECVVKGETYAFFGSSHVSFRDGHIHSINEYERTREQVSYPSNSSQVRWAN